MYRCGHAFCSAHSTHEIPLNREASIDRNGVLCRVCDTCYETALVVLGDGRRQQPSDGVYGQPVAAPGLLAYGAPPAPMQQHAPVYAPPHMQAAQPATFALLRPPRDVVLPPELPISSEAEPVPLTVLLADASVQLEEMQTVYELVNGIGDVDARREVVLEAGHGIDGAVGALTRSRDLLEAVMRDNALEQINPGAARYYRYCTGVMNGAMTWVANIRLELLGDAAPQPGQRQQQSQLDDVLPEMLPTAEEDEEDLVRRTMAHSLQTDHDLGPDAAAGAGPSTRPEPPAAEATALPTPSREADPADALLRRVQALESDAERLAVETVDAGGAQTQAAQLIEFKNRAQETQADCTRVGRTDFVRRCVNVVAYVDDVLKGARRTSALSENDRRLQAISELETRFYDLLSAAGDDGDADANALAKKLKSLKNDCAAMQKTLAQPTTAGDVAVTDHARNRLGDLQENLGELEFTIRRRADVVQAPAARIETAHERADDDMFGL